MVQNGAPRQGCFEKVKPDSRSTGRIEPSVISKNSFLQTAAVKMKYESIILKMKHKC